jgi:hypothetical protein
MANSLSLAPRLESIDGKEAAVGCNRRIRRVPAAVAGFACTTTTGWTAFYCTLAATTATATIADAETGVLLLSSLRITSDTAHNYFLAMNKAWTGGDMTGRLIHCRLHVVAGAEALQNVRFKFKNAAGTNVWESPYWYHSYASGGINDADHYVDDRAYEFWIDAEDCTLTTGSIDWPNLAKLDIIFGKNTGTDSTEIIVDVDWIGFHAKPTKGILAVYMDDGTDHEFEALAYAWTKGLRMTLNLTTGLVGVGSYVSSWDKVRSAHAQGHLIANHTRNHKTDWAYDDPPDAWLRDFALAAKDLAQHGMPEGARIASVPGHISATPIGVYAADGPTGLFDLLVTSSVNLQSQSVGQHVYHYTHGREFTADADVTALETLVHRVIANKSVSIVLTHLNYERTDALMARWKTFVDHLAGHVAAGDLYHMTLAELAEA